VVGAGAAGTIKLLSATETDPYWAAASWIGAGLAIWSLFLGNSEVRQAVFERAIALQALAIDIAEARRRAILGGTEQEIADRYMELHGHLREELERLGPDHSHYADLHRKRLTRRLRAVSGGGGANQAADRPAPLMPSMATGDIREILQRRTPCT
jgi:hypothetical protein